MIQAQVVETTSLKSVFLGDALQKIEIVGMRICSLEFRTSLPTTPTEAFETG